MKKVIAVLLFMACASIACAQVPSDVPRDHWAYEAVRSLIDKGYITGYPNGDFLGNRTLTRYEFATVVKRILDDMNVRFAAAQQGATTQTTPTAPAQAAPSGVSKQDLDTISKLVDEFKAELLVIGTRLDRVEADINQMKPCLDNVNSILTDPEGAFEAMRSDVNNLKKVSVSGWVQERYSWFDGDLNSPTTAAPSNFSVRRSRIKIAGKPSANSTVVIQYDAGQNYEATSAPTITLKDAYVEYDFAGDVSRGLSTIFGQTVWPFGYEVPQGDPSRESPERALITQRLFPNERDRGMYFSYPFMDGKVMWKLGVFNGVQASEIPPNDGKAGVSNVRVNLGNLDVGASAWFGKTIENATGGVYFGNDDPKTRYGLDAEYYLNNVTLKAGVHGRSRR